MQALANHPWLVGAAAALLIAGYLLRRWAGRHDLKGLALDAAWQVAKNRGDPKTETELGHRIKELQADASNVGRAKKVAGTAARHVLAQVAGLAGIVAMLASAGLAGLAFYLK